MTIRKPRVLLSHPAKHYHFYQIALAANDAGLLEKFITGAYYLPDRLPYRMLKVLPHRWTDKTANRLEARRSIPGVDTRRIESMPYREMAFRCVERLPLFRDIVGRRNLVLGYNASYDAAVARQIAPEASHFVHCLWGSAWKTFLKAKRVGATTILDMMISPLADQHVDPEYRQQQTRQWRGSRREQAEVALADYIFSPSEFVSSDVAAMGFPRSRIIEIPYGVEVERFTPRKERSDDCFHILFVGHVALRKGIQYLLEAFKNLRLPNCRLTIVGTPVDLPSEEVLKASLGSITWIPRIAYDELHRCYQNSDLFVFPSLAEGSALVTYEALACGLPLIVTKNAGSVVRDGIEGFVVPVRDPQAIESKIKCLYENKVLARTMGVAARARAEEFSWPRFRQRVIEAYENIALRRTASAER